MFYYILTIIFSLHYNKNIRMLFKLLKYVFSKTPSINVEGRQYIQKKKKNTIKNIFKPCVY